MSRVQGVCLRMENSTIQKRSTTMTYITTCVCTLHATHTLSLCLYFGGWGGGGTDETRSQPVGLTDC